MTSTCILYTRAQAHIKKSPLHSEIQRTQSLDFIIKEFTTIRLKKKPAYFYA